MCTQRIPKIVSEGFKKEEAKWGVRQVGCGGEAGTGDLVGGKGNTNAVALSRLVKVCTRCKEGKPKTGLFWTRNSDSRDGFYSICKECRKRSRKAEKKPLEGMPKALDDLFLRTGGSSGQKN